MTPHRPRVLVVDDELEMGELVADIARGKITERYKPLVKRLMARAYWENNPDAPAVEAEPLAAE